MLLLCVGLLFTGCEGLKTPEELIGPPQSDVEKKELTDIIQRFLPVDAEILLIPQGQRGLSTEPIARVNVADDEKEEIVALYRDKMLRKIGIIVLQENQGTWVNMLEEKIEAFEISDYMIMDLDDDGKNEVLLGYFSVTDLYKELNIYGLVDTKFQKVYETEYLAMDLNNTNQKNEVEIALSTIGNASNNNKFALLNYKDQSIRKVGELVYPEDIEIYKILYGKASSGKQAYFIDMYNKDGIGKSDIVSYSSGDLFSLVRERGLNEVTQDIPTTSTDTNGDGIIELIGNKILVEEDGAAQLVLNSFFSLGTDELTSVGKLYRDYDLNIEVLLNPIAEDKVSVTKMDKHLKFYYHSVKENRKIEFLDVLRVDSTEAESYRSTHTVIEERYGQLIMAKTMLTDRLSGNEKNEFEKLYNSIKNVSDIVRFVE